MKTKFKIGDMVKRINGDNCDFKDGDIATIISLDGELYCDVKMKNRTISYGNSQSNLEKVKSKINQQKLTHIIIYDIEDKDPVIFCYSYKEMKKEVETLFHKDEVKKDSIRIIEVKKELKLVTNVSIKEVK